MNPRVVVLGFMSHFPVAGVAWQTLHYLVGLERLGYRAYYVEAHGCNPSKLMERDTDDGAARAADYIARLLGRFDLGDRWAYHQLYPHQRHFGMSAGQLRDLYRSAALIINLHGSHLPRPELADTGRLVYLETDPVEVEIDVYHRHPETLTYLEPHAAFFTFGENLGREDCLLPSPREFSFHPTRQPVVLDLWEGLDAGPGSVFTTVGNWNQPYRERRFRDDIYSWSKHHEFLKIIDLPRRVSQPFELALASYTPDDQQLLESHGWQVRPAMAFSRDLDAYRRYLAGSRGEFTVAKDQNVRLRSGWFSDRAATYLAAGRPVITQETGFSNLLPTGDGLFSFRTVDEIVEAVQAINADYDHHRRVARAIAHDYFSHEAVLTPLLGEMGLTPRVPRPARGRTDAGLPDELPVEAVSRWPTRLPPETLRIAAALTLPDATPAPIQDPFRASVVMVTYNALAYTRMCLAGLLEHGWREDDELLCVDNASTDDTPAFLQELAARHPFVRVIENRENRGFAAATNQGLAAATGNAFILLNNDTLVTAGWRDRLLSHLGDSAVGLVGPVTNRTCNEAQIDAPYRTYAEMKDFAADYTGRAHEPLGDLRMLAMFCVALRRDVYDAVGGLDEQFEVGMFEDDDYARRVRQAGYRIVCAEDVFVHHFGQASLGELCRDGAYDRILADNRRRFETKWGVAWEPHGRRITPAYEELRRRLHTTVRRVLPAGATALIVSKGDDDLLELDGRRGWHFPRSDDGSYASHYPADSAAAIAHLESLREQGGGFLVVPKPAFWWLDFYRGFSQHLRDCYGSPVHDEDTCLIFDLRQQTEAPHA